MGEYRKERLLLEGQVKLIIDPMEFRMALWINGFGLSDAVTGEEIIPLCHSYNLEHVEEAGDQLEIDFRIYPEGHVYYHVAVDPFARTFTYKGKAYSTDDFIKRYKLKNPRYLGTFCVDGKQTAKKLFVHGFYILVSFLSDIICIMNIGSCYGGDIIPQNGCNKINVF